MLLNTQKHHYIITYTNGACIATLFLAFTPTFALHGDIWAYMMIAEEEAGLGLGS